MRKRKRSEDSASSTFVGGTATNEITTCWWRQKRQLKFTASTSLDARTRFSVHPIFQHAQQTSRFNLLQSRSSLKHVATSLLMTFPQSKIDFRLLFTFKADKMACNPAMFILFCASPMLHVVES